MSNARVVWSSRWKVGALLATLAALVGGSIQSAEDSKPSRTEMAARQRSQNNLKMLAIAMHNHNDTFGRLPAAATYSKEGKPLLSWRVKLLPFLEEDKLYKEFHQDEPWDSEHNKKLLDRMPKVYAPVLGKNQKGHDTYYQLFVGPETAFRDQNAPRIPASFPDGTSNTILIAEGGKAVPWTKPEDLKYDDKKALPKLGGLFKNGFNVALADGSARFVDTKKVSEQTLRHAIMPADGMVLGTDW